MSSNTNELATAELVDRGLEALKSREYRQALTLWEEVHRRHPEHPRATRLVQELRAWLERRNTVKPRTDRSEDQPRATPTSQEATGDLHRVERRIQDLEQRLESTVRRKSELLDEINDLHAHYREREDELQRTADTRIQRLNEEIAELRENDQRLRNQQLETSQELVRYERERDDAQLRANSLANELDRERRNTEDLRSRIDDLREEQSSLRTELAAFNQDEIEELREIADTIEPLHQELRDAHQTIENLEEAHARLQANLVDANEHLRSVEAANAEQQDRLLEQLERSNTNHRDLATRLDSALQQLEAAQQTNDELTQSAQKTQSSETELNEALEAARKDNATWAAELEKSTRRNEMLVGQLRAVEERLAALVPLDDDVGKRAREISDSFDISALLENEDELRAEFTHSTSEEADSEDGATQQAEAIPEESLPSVDESASDLAPDNDDTTHEPATPTSADSDQATSQQDEEQADYTDTEVGIKAGDFSLENDDDDLTDLLGSSMNSLLDDDDDDFVDLDSPSAQSYRSSRSSYEEEFELANPEEHPGYSGEFEALLMSTPDLSVADDLDEAQVAADRFRSLANQPDAVVSAVTGASADESELTPMSAFVLSRINQQVRIGELIDTMGLPASKTISCLEELEQSGFIEVEA